MYSSPSYGSPPAELSNNPFIDHPANALTRFPDINAVDSGAGSSGQYTQWMQQQPSSSFATTPTGYQGQMYSGGGGYQQPQLASQQTGWASPGYGQQSYGVPQQSQQMSGRPGFQPSSSFGQQLAGEVGGGDTRMPQQQQQQPPQQQYGGYQQPQPSQFGAGYQPAYAQQQQPQQAPSYLSEFDPYSQAAAQQQQQAYGGVPVQPGQRPPHPREYVQQHKQQLESWDAYSWKQVSSRLRARTAPTRA